jgi:hypothetical protein
MWASRLEPLESQAPCFLHPCSRACGFDAFLNVETDILSRKWKCIESPTQESTFQLRGMATGYSLTLKHLSRGHYSL